MKLCAFTVTAWRMGDEERPEVSFHTGWALFDDDRDDIHAALIEQAHVLYPEADGWCDWDADWHSAPPGAAFGPYRLTWQAEKEATI